MRGRPLVVRWQESSDELYQRYQAERHVHRRVRLQALWLLCQGKPIGEVSQLVGVDYRTIQRWLAWYRSGGLAAVLRRVPGHAAPGRAPRLSPEQMAELREHAAAGNFRTVWDAVAWVAKEWGIDYTYTGMHALLHRQPTRPKRSGPHIIKVNGCRPARRAS